MRTLMRGVFMLSLLWVICLLSFHVSTKVPSEGLFRLLFALTFVASVAYAVYKEKPHE